MSRSQSSYASARRKPSAESHSNADTGSDEHSRTRSRKQASTCEPSSPTGSRPRSVVRPRSTKSSPVPTCSINSVQRLADLCAGDHVTWADRGSPMLVVGVGYKHVDSVPRAVPARKHDQPTYEFVVKLRGKDGGECELYHRPNGPTSLLAVPLNKFGWIDRLYRLGPRVRGRSPSRSRPADGIRAGGAQ